MDTVYGTKKYFQSLSGANDIYRSQACRSMINDYSYQNTVGRRSNLSAYYHMNKQPAYTNELSLNSHYSYNGWGMWRDGRNVAPSSYSAKTHHAHYKKSRSFSIIFIAAVFIVLLAVVSIGGLAFYFSSLKANLEDPIMGFEGSFRIAKGDLFSTGLKYNHTTTYKQKIEFYRRFLDRAFSDNGLAPLRTDIWGFGDGPLIEVSFRIFLDVRKLPQHVHSVEEHIKDSLILETTMAKSLYHSLRIDADSIEVKRVLDEQLIKAAMLHTEMPSVPTSQTQLEKRLLKKGSNSPAVIAKSPSTMASRPHHLARPHSVEDEPDVDIENAPVIQGSFEGSFEITKTDADIAHKKVAPTKAYSDLTSKAVTPFPLRVKAKKPVIEKLTTVVPTQSPTTHTTASSKKSIRTTTSASVRSTTLRSTTESTTTKATTISTLNTSTRASTSTTSAPKVEEKPTIRTTTQKPMSTESTTSEQLKATMSSSNKFPFPLLTTPSSVVVVPKLDTNLFTSMPVLDTQPWKPIHREVPELIPGPPPAFPTKSIPKVHQYSKDVPQRRTDEIELPFLPDNPAPPAASPVGTFAPYPPPMYGSPSQSDHYDEALNVKDILFFRNYGNVGYGSDEDDVERLGAGASIQPHPLPVPLIEDVVIPSFRPIAATAASVNKFTFIEPEDTKFEHLGDGVIVKKHEYSEQPSNSTMEVAQVNDDNGNIGSNNAVVVGPSSIPQMEAAMEAANSELADTIGDLFMDLLNIPSEVNGKTEGPPIMESHVQQHADTNGSAESTQKPIFLNLKEIILKRKQENESLPQSNNTKTTSMPTIWTTVKNTVNTTAATISTPVTTFRNAVSPTAHKKPSIILDDSNLFPSQSKWEFANSSSLGGYGHKGNMRKVFNKTLQAWVSEDVNESEIEHFTLDEIKTRINNASNIQDISLIFDTLASKLGITPSVATKVPPFSHNKRKPSSGSRDEGRPHIKFVSTSSTTTTTTSRPTTSTLSTSTSHSQLHTTEKEMQLSMFDRNVFIKPMSSFMEDVASGSSEGIGAAIPVVGEAEVEVIDPNRYDEILQSSKLAESTTGSTVPELVTLLPVRSNSGIRTYRPLNAEGKDAEVADLPETMPSLPTLTSNGFQAQKQSLVRKDVMLASSLEHARRFPPEAIVKGGLSVDIK